MHKIYNNISLAYKAKKLILGTDEIIRSIRRSKTLILIDSTASVNTFKTIQNKAEYYGSDIVVINDIDGNLQKIFKGKQIKVMAFKDKGFIKLIHKNIEE